MAYVPDLGVLVGRIERASRQVVWETQFEKSAGLAGLYESGGGYARPAGVAYHGLALGRGRDGIVVEAFATYDADGAAIATRSIAKTLDVPVGIVRLVPCQGLTAHLGAGSAGGHAGLVASGSYGTIGGFASDLHSNLILAVSNNHVFAQMNHASVGDVLVDGKRKPFGALLRYHPLRPQPAVNELDGAVGWIHRARPPKLPRGMALRGAGSVRVGMRVHKWGARTGYTVGRVRAVFGNPLVNYPGLGALNFRSCLRIVGSDGAFSLPGDSGSLVLDDDGQVVGIVFAGENTGQFSLANPVSALTGHLGIAF